MKCKGVEMGAIYGTWQI